MASLKEKLLKLRGFLTRERWCKGSYVLKNGKSLVPSHYSPHEVQKFFKEQIPDPDRVDCQFCITGAMLYLDIYTFSVLSVIARKAYEIKYKPGYAHFVNCDHIVISFFNDSMETKYEDVIEVIDKTIEDILIIEKNDGGNAFTRVGDMIERLA